MNGMQRETQNHVEEELEWASGFYIMSLLVSLLGLTVQVASSDYELYNVVLREVRQVSFLFCFLTSKKIAYTRTNLVI